MDTTKLKKILKWVTGFILVCIVYNWQTAEKPREWNMPTNPRYLEAYKFAHSLKLPDSVPKPVPYSFLKYNIVSTLTTFVPFLNWKVIRNESNEYYDHLCSTEAGEWIFKKVDNVESIYQMRPMLSQEEANKVFKDKYAMEDPADWSGQEGSAVAVYFIGKSTDSNHFKYYESMMGPKEMVNPVFIRDWRFTRDPNYPYDAPYWKYFGEDFNGNSIKKPKADPINKISAKFGYTWRGIKRPRDREFGIAGGELIVLDLQTNEILAVRRSFTKAQRNYNISDISWEVSPVCPPPLHVSDKSSDWTKGEYPFSFIIQVLNSTSNGFHN